MCRSLMVYSFEEDLFRTNSGLFKRVQGFWVQGSLPGFQRELSRTLREPGETRHFQNGVKR